MEYIVKGEASETDEECDINFLIKVLNPVKKSIQSINERISCNFLSVVERIMERCWKETSYFVSGKFEEKFRIFCNDLSDKDPNNQTLAAEVPGEETETESDEEIYGKTFGNNETRSTFNGPFTRMGLLQRNLAANNVRIIRCSKSLIKNYVLPSSKKIVSCDQVLVRSQVFLQSVTQSLNLVHMNTKQLRQRANDVMALKIIPDIVFTESLSNNL